MTEARPSEGAPLEGDPEDGDADAGLWPGANAIGAGLRGGAWTSGSTSLRVSDRIFAAFTAA